MQSFFFLREPSRDVGKGGREKAYCLAAHKMEKKRKGHSRFLAPPVERRPQGTEHKVTREKGGKLGAGTYSTGANGRSSSPTFRPRGWRERNSEATIRRKIRT